MHVVPQSGFVQSSLPAAYSETAASGRNVGGMGFGEFAPVTLDGQVFSDLNADGKIEAGETGLAGWTVNLLNGSNQVIAAATTDSTGAYSFAGVGPGTDRIAVVQQAGYLPSTAASYPVSPSSGLNVPGFDFGEFLAVTLGGMVFDDLNADGVPDPGETGLAGWTVDLLNGSSQLVGIVTSDSSGDYTFTGVAPGSYTVQEVLQAGYVRTTSPATHALTVSQGQTVTGLNFGDVQAATVGGTLFQDSNQDGTLDGGESGLSGWTVDLLDGAGQVIAAATDSGGAYSFAGLAPGHYTLRDVLQPGYIQTVPTPGSYAVVAGGGARISGEDFGVFKAVSLAVTGLKTVPSGGLRSGTGLVVEWSDTNNGTLPAAGPFFDLVTVLNTTTGAVLGSATVPYNAATHGNLAAGAVRRSAGHIPPPRRQSRRGPDPVHRHRG